MCREFERAHVHAIRALPALVVHAVPGRNVFSMQIKRTVHLLTTRFKRDATPLFVCQKAFVCSRLVSETTRKAQTNIRKEKLILNKKETKKKKKKEEMRHELTQHFKCRFFGTFSNLDTVNLFLNPLIRHPFGRPIRMIKSKCPKS